jgi:hypothetical protein
MYGVRVTCTGVALTENGQLDAQASGGFYRGWLSVSGENMEKIFNHFLEVFRANRITNDQVRTICNFRTCRMANAGVKQLYMCGIGGIVGDIYRSSAETVVGG